MALAALVVDPTNELRHRSALSSGDFLERRPESVLHFSHWFGARKA
jgi:hypothetical protein